MDQFPNSVHLFPYLEVQDLYELVQLSPPLLPRRVHVFTAALEAALVAMNGSYKLSVDTDFEDCPSSDSFAIGYSTRPSIPRLLCFIASNVRLAPLPPFPLFPSPPAPTLS